MWEVREQASSQCWMDSTVRARWRLDACQLQARIANDMQTDIRKNSTTQKLARVNDANSYRILPNRSEQTQ
eukprot:4406106-Pleurochrysis_carterae.AAC.3